jgi:glycosyltransferase involved in cell wall biosynthesis
VRILGQIGNMPEFYRGLDVFVLASLSEGMPLVVLEAMASGVPVVATRLPGTEEIIEDGLNGMLVPGGDAGALASALQRLSNDAGMRRELGLAGRRRVHEHFSIERVGSEVAEVYDSLLGASN